MTYVLSFKPVPVMGTHDPSASISQDGDIIAGAEEERFIRNKQAIGVFPARAINYCLKEADVSIEDVDIAIPYSPDKFKKKRRSDIINNSLNSKIKNAGMLLLENRADSSRSKIRDLLNKNFGDKDYSFRFYDHHLCHAASAYYPSGFETAVTITMDGRGEYDSTVIWSLDEGDNLRRERTEPVRNSLGFFYGVVTEYLGYRVRNGAGKVMGLAPYGDDNDNFREKFYQMVELTKDGYDVTELAEIKTEGGYSKAVEYFEEVIGYSRRKVGDEFDQEHKDIAYLAQQFLEEAAINIVKDAIDRTGEKKVCLSGGIALNCKMNKKIRELDAVEDLFIQPVSSDSGLSLGAVLEHSKELGYDVKYEMTNPYLGPQYTDDEVRDTLEKVKCKYKKVANPSQLAAKYIADGELVGWFQGRLEMGPRALGHRSILADPRDIKSKDRVNFYVKHRENWRPFAPSILEDYANDYLRNAKKSPFMIDTFESKKEKRKDMQAVLHPADDTTRPQTVTEDNSPKYYQLIDEFRKITGVPLVLNTSFNDSGEPIVNTPRDAIKDFSGMGLDVLVIGDYVIKKE